MVRIYMSLKTFSLKCPLEIGTQSLRGALCKACSIMEEEKRLNRSLSESLGQLEKEVSCRAKQAPGVAQTDEGGARAFAATARESRGEVDRGGEGAKSAHHRTGGRTEVPAKGAECAGLQEPGEVPMAGLHSIRLQSSCCYY